ncbi:glycosyltransferase family 25 protein [Marinobacter mobilis]|uniref:Glycosyl transferase, family 25 n=1 Tax=Marinobacter mobilis TaxID=488533 RepID=A0A1H2TJM9_9GAMM|nr:glycosyltransferase family 25 protein [Marinobacter mobilis]SDW44038.1 glycosyl transferase, family 25 [Marinobacter mobilis]
MTNIDNPPKNVEVLLISLDKDNHRRHKLKSRFPANYHNFRLVHGIDLTAPRSPETDFRCLPLPHSHLTLSNTEIGCAQSHIKALEIAQKSKAHSVLILEDDVIGGDQDIESISQISQNLPHHHFLLCGGQEGLRGSSYLYAPREQDYFRLPPITLRFTARACCYAVSPSMAGKILKRQNDNLRRADDWRHLLSGERELYYSQHLQHPRDLSGSHLEKDRSMLSHEPFWKRVYKDGLTYTTLTQILKATLPIVARLKGWVKIPTGDERPSSKR